MSTVFISYRRETAAGEARALCNELVSRLGKDAVFMDVDSIDLGRDFRSVLQKTLDSCDFMLVVIDKNWIKDDDGLPRLEHSNDFVRMEIEAALKRDIVVTPVLVRGARMPGVDQLPAEIADLAYRNGFELSHNRWESDVRELIRRLRLDESEDSRPPDADRLATVPEHARRKPATNSGAAGRRTFLWLAVAVVAAATGAIGVQLWPDPDVRPPGRAENGFNGDVTTNVAPAGFTVTDYLGGWANVDRNTRGLTWISVRKDGDGLIVQVWGKCHPTDCDWGVAKARPFGRSVATSGDAAVNSVAAKFTPGFAETRLKLSLTANDKLTAVVDTHFIDGSGRADYEMTEQFIRASTSLPSPN